MSAYVQEVQAGPHGVGWTSLALLETACSRKLLICTRLLKQSSIHLPYPALSLLGWFNRWTVLLYDAYDAIERQNQARELAISSRSGFDRDTAGGVMSRDNILKLLTHPVSPSQDDLPPVSDVPIAPKRRSRKKELSAEAQAAKAAIMSRLRPRKTA